ncbi:MAG: hypothetical protein K5985_03715 [Lachnospiraceae bacterium]|nr:hypothetical protein [Lachnospiraceae bacterium]
MKVWQEYAKIKGPARPVYLTGGLCEEEYFRKLLSDRIGREVRSCERARYAGAIGAAVLAGKNKEGEKVLPQNTCTLIKASVGARIGKTCPYFRIADMFVGETTCDGKKKAYNGKRDKYL